MDFLAVQVVGLFTRVPTSTVVRRNLLLKRNRTWTLRVIISTNAASKVNIVHFAKRDLLVCHFETLLSALLQHLNAHVDSVATQGFLSMKL